MKRHAFFYWPLLVGFSAGPAFSMAAPFEDARQSAEIAALIQELTYLIDHTERLATRYKADRASVTFNYAALLEQLRLTRQRSAEYLNERHQLVHAAPPPPVQSAVAQRH